MSLLKWQALPKSKTNVRNRINFVRKTIKGRKLGEIMSQESYQKLFRPVTSKLDEVTNPVTGKLDDVKFFIFPKNKSKKKTVGNEDELGLNDLFDVEEEGIQPQGEKKIPTQPPDYEGLPLEDPPYYSPGVDYSKVKYDDNKILNDIGLENYKDFEKSLEEFKGEDRESYYNLFMLDLNDKRKEIPNSKRENTRKINNGSITEEKGKQNREKLNIQGEVLDRFKLYLKNLKVGKGLTGGNIMFFNNPNELLKKLEIILGEIAAGNTSIKMRNMGVKILDILLKTKTINKTQHKKRFKYFNI